MFKKFVCSMILFVGLLSATITVDAATTTKPTPTPIKKVTTVKPVVYPTVNIYPSNMDGTAFAAKAILVKGMYYMPLTDMLDNFQLIDKRTITESGKKADVFTFPQWAFFCSTVNNISYCAINSNNLIPGASETEILDNIHSGTWTGDNGGNDKAKQFPPMITYNKKLYVPLTMFNFITGNIMGDVTDSSGETTYENMWSYYDKSVKGIVMSIPRKGVMNTDMTDSVENGIGQWVPENCENWVFKDSNGYDIYENTSVVFGGGVLGSIDGTVQYEGEYKFADITLLEYFPSDTYPTEQDLIDMLGTSDWRGKSFGLNVNMIEKFIPFWYTPWFDYDSDFVAG